MGTTRGKDCPGIRSEERLRNLDATCAALCVQFHEHCISSELCSESRSPTMADQGERTEKTESGRIPDLADSLVGLLHFPGLGPSASWLPVSSELPVPHGVTSTLLPLVRQIQDQYMTELQRVNALYQDQSNQWLQLLRKHAQQDRPVTIWECTLHHDAVQHKFDGVRCWLKRLYSDWIDNLVKGNRNAKSRETPKKRSSIDVAADSILPEAATTFFTKKAKLDAADDTVDELDITPVAQQPCSNPAHATGDPSMPIQTPPPPPLVSAPLVQQLEEELGAEALWPELAHLSAEQEGRHDDAWFERETGKADGCLDTTAVDS